MINLTRETIIQRNDKIITNQVEDEYGMMDLEAGKYYALDSVGADIWDLIENPIRYGDLIIKLVEIYDITEEMCYNDTKDLVREMIKSAVVYAKEV